MLRCRRRRHHRQLTELDYVNSNVSRSSSSSINSDRACSAHIILQLSQVFVGRIKYYQVLLKKKREEKELCDGIPWDK